MQAAEDQVKKEGPERTGVRLDRPVEGHRHVLTPSWGAASLPWAGPGGSRG